MDKDIEKIIENSYVPDMEFVKPRRTTEPIEVPEIVLPKTKSEMYEEAKDRLEQKTRAVSKAFEPGKRKKSGQNRQPKKKTEVKTVELDSAAAAVVGAKSNEERDNLTKLKTRLNNLKKIVEEPKWVGSADELVPFAWRHPLIAEIEHPTKFYRAAVRSDKNRSEFLPAPRERG